MNVKQLIAETIGVVILALIFTAMYPLVGGSTGVVATIWANATSPGYVGAGFVGLANLVPTLYVIAVIVGVVLTFAGLIYSSGGRKGGRF